MVIKIMLEKCWALGYNIKESKTVIEQLESGYNC